MKVETKSTICRIEKKINFFGTKRGNLFDTIGCAVSSRVSRAATLVQNVIQNVTANKIYSYLLAEKFCASSFRKVDG